MPRRKYTTIGRACQLLSLSGDFRPVTQVAQIFTGIKLEEIIDCLRASSDENAGVICALYDRLPKSLRTAINLDYLIAAAHCKDHHAIAGLVCEQYSRVKNIEASMIASQQSPGIVRNFAERAKTKNGFNHGKLLLQTSGVAPTPKNQTTHISMIGNRIDNSKNVSFNNVPAHHMVVTEVGEILRQLPSHATSPDHSPEDQGHRDR